MDPVTHAASGVVALLALRNRPATLWSLPIAAIACASPDIDLAFIHSPLEFLQLHRGITHSFAASPVLGLILALLAWPLWRPSTPGRWRFSMVWLFCTAMIWLHIWLDVVTTYGTMVFLPFSHYRVRLNAIFMIDLLITLPMLWAIWRWRARTGLMLLTLAWIFIYPGIGIMANIWHTNQWQARLANNPGATGQMTVLPDALAPLFWRVLYIENTPTGQMVAEQSLNAFGKPRTEPEYTPAAPGELQKIISQASIAGETYFKFAVLPVIQDLRPEDRPELVLPDSSLYMFYDLRFGSGLQFVRDLMAMRPNADMPFQLMAEIAPASNQQPVERIRLRFSDSGRDSSWHKPEPPQKASFWQWLVGVEE